jgi:hypothetical protein
MPATKLRREQLNISLNDLLWLDRQKVGGNVRKFKCADGESLRLESFNNNTYIDISYLDLTLRFDSLTGGKIKFEVTEGIALNLTYISNNYSFKLWTEDGKGVKIQNESGSRYIDLNPSDFIEIAGRSVLLKFNSSYGVVAIHPAGLGASLNFGFNNTLSLFTLNTDDTSNLSLQSNYIKVGNKLGVGLVPIYTLDVNGNVRAFGDFLSSKTSAVNIGTLTNQSVLIITNNTPVIYVTNNGRVGIGILPNAVFEVLNEIRVRLDNTMLPEKNVARIVPLGVSGVTGAQNWALRGVYQYGNGVSYNSNGGDLDLIKSWNGNSILATKYDGTPLGKVGIGTTVPNYKLDVNGDIRCFGDLLSSKVSTVNIGTLTNQAVQIITNNTARIIIPTTGYIDFKLPVKMNEGIVVDWEKRENCKF